MSNTIKNQFDTDGFSVIESFLTESQTDTLLTEFNKIAHSAAPIHNHYLTGAHNPWGISASLFDAWSLLDFCLSPQIVDLAATVIGEDIILWESSFVDVEKTVNSAQWLQQANFWPIEPMDGVLIRVPIMCDDLQLILQIGSQLKSPAAGPLKTVNINDNSKIFIQHPLTRYRYKHARQCSLTREFFLHFIPSSSLFCRDNSHPAHRYMTSRYPLINYANSPIWLARGTDKAGNDFARGFSPTIGQWVQESDL